MNTHFKILKNNLDAEVRHFMGEDYKEVRVWIIPTEHSIYLGYRYSKKSNVDDVQKEKIVNKIYSMLHEKFPEVRSLVFKS